MSILAIEVDISATFTHVVSDRFLYVERLTQLVEVANLQIRAVFNRSGLWLQLPQKQA